MKTSQNPNHGLAKFSHLSLTSKNNDIPTSSSKNTESMSKYFAIKKCSKEEDEDMSTLKSPESPDSPYKNFLTYIKHIPLVDDANDFKTPKPVKKVLKTIQGSGVSLNKQIRTRKSKTKKTRKSKNSIFKIAKDNFGQMDINPDHLQMALALSKSTYAIENPEKSKNVEENLPTFLSPEKIAKVRTTLEKFGFKSDKAKIHPDVKKNIVEVSKRHRQSKFRFITPILQTRTPEERESIITSKISLIINQNTHPIKEVPHAKNEYELFSDILKTYHKENIIFTANRLKLDETVYFDYYSKGLNITPTKYQCGHLLKKWEEIPGRDKSPVRKEIHHSKEDLNKNCDKMLLNYENVSSKTNIKDVDMDFQKDNTKDENKSHEINTASITLCRNKTDHTNNLSEETTVSRNCISPDLFESEDETDVLPKTPETENIFSQSFLNLSPSKSQGLLRSKTTILESDILQEKHIELTKRNVFKNDQGIEHFESYSNDVKHLSQEIYHLMQSSEDEDTEELYLNSLKNNETPVVRDDNLTRDSLNMVINDEQPIVHDLTQSSSDEATIDGFEITGNYKNKANEIKQTEHLIGKAIKEKYKVGVNFKETYSNFDMSPLHIKDSNEFMQDSSFSTETKLSTKTGVESECKLIDQSHFSSRKSSGIKVLNFDSTVMLNVTDYVNEILNKDDQGTVENVDEAIAPNNSNNDKNYSKVYKESLNNLNFETAQSRFNHTINIKNVCENLDKLQNNAANLSPDSCSQESIVISDEELNYSSVYSRHTKSKCFYDLSDIEEFDQNIVDNDEMDIEETNNVHSVLKSKYGSRSISEPIHDRITVLKRMSLTRQSLAKEFLEDSFNNLLEDTDILDTIESAAKSIETSKRDLMIGAPANKENFESKHGNIVTPEKYNLQIMPRIESGITPENNLIIKTNNITPMANYDEMDTPKITKELQEFGLKPLKRQRGVKLLKHLYECTHPLVGPKEIKELSSDEDDHRIIKKKKKKHNTIDDNKINLTLLERDNCRWDEGNVDIVGDLLLKNENLEDLIFERKYSVKIPSCRVPLQIVWHNFVSRNPEIKENILLYEPLQLEVLHSMLKEQSGCKFHIQDLLAFFDKKCITVRTAQAQGGRKARR